MLAMILWYILVTMLGVVAAYGYNSWIDNRCHEKYRMPSSVLTSFGVAGVEVMRVIRSAPLIWYVAGRFDFPDPVSIVSLFIAWYTVDVVTAYGTTGLVMILGNIRREGERQVNEQIAEIEGN